MRDKGGLRAQMYAYSIASAQVAPAPLRYRLKPEFMLQPPFDMMLHDGRVRPVQCNCRFAK